MRRRLDYPDLKRAVRTQAEYFRPSVILIEDRASGTQLIQELIRDSVSNVTRYDPSMDKVMRLHSVSGTIENGFVYLPTEADWLAAYLHELTTFPNGKHDDQADSTSQALDWARQWPSRLPLDEFNRHQLMKWKLGLPDEYFFTECDEDDGVFIAQYLWNGKRIHWDGKFWQRQSKILITETDVNR